MSRNRRRRPGAQAPGGGRAMVVRPSDLGDLSGPVVEPITASFDYFGKRFRVNPELSETVLIDLYTAAGQVALEAESVKHAGDILVKSSEDSKQYVREHIHPDDFEEFWATVRANRQSLREVIALCFRVVALVSERPTSPPSDSSDGRRDISQNSQDGALPQGEADEGSVPEWWPEGVPYSPKAAEFVDTFEQRGRPDLANFVMLAQESRAASATPTA